MPTQTVVAAEPNAERPHRSRGQILVIYVMSIIVIVGLMGLVIDVTWYWSNSLRVQRAADAAALAGAVDLPAKPGTAASHAIGTAIGDAIAQAQKNGYTTLTFGCAADGDSPSSNPGICIHPDSGNSNQLDVKISAPVQTFFMRVFGIQSLTATRDAAAVFTLPVPMGSPDAYYGVGNFKVNVTNTDTVDYTNASVPTYTSVPLTAWTNPNNAWTTAALYATSATDAQAQQWSLLKIPTISGATLDGFTIAFDAGVGTAAAACQVKAEASWNSGNTGSWNSTPLTTPTLTTANTAAYTLGSPTDLTVWGSGHTWAAGDFLTNNFRVRMTYLRGAGCGTLSLNSLLVTVYSHTDTTTTTATVTNDGSGNAGLYDGPNNTGTFLASRGAFGAIITKGGDQKNGDAYAPANNTSYTPTNNTQYDPNGYNYIVNLPAGGTVKVFDPGFCAMGSNGSSGNLGTGDHWIGAVGTPVSTYYTLWDTNGRPDLQAVWTEVYTSGTLFQGETGFDPANATMGAASGTLTGATSGCNTNGSDAYHNLWWTMPTQPSILGAGTYAVQVQTTKTAHVSVAADATQNQNTNAENMFAIEAVGANAPQVYGNGRMTVYNNLPPSSTQQFYLAQIDQRTGAGKTALIDLFDPGDLSTAAGSNGTLQVLSPDGGSPHVVNFNYSMDKYPTTNCKTQTGTSACSGGTNVSQIVTTWNGKQATDNTWIHIAIPLPTTYGQTLWNNGWWQIQYTVTLGASDTTTWQVSVSGNPVHLVVP